MGFFWRSLLVAGDIGGIWVRGGSIRAVRSGEEGFHKHGVTDSYNSCISFRGRSWASVYRSQWGSKVSRVPS